MIDRALRFIQQWGLKDVELAFAFNDFRTIRRVPLEKIALKYSEE